LGYAKDRFAAEELRKVDAPLFEEWKNTESTSKFLAFDEVVPLDGKRLEDAKKLAVEERSDAQKSVIAADIQGNRNTLKVDSFIPAGMAVIYLLLMLYFKSIGGYRPIRIGEER
jgi:predicted protein tyrosine phosphatase